MRLLLLFAALAQEPQSRPQADVVVTARAEDAARALQSCLQRQCPPEQDVAATLALAEQQVEDGDYFKARSTLRASLGRNRRFAKTRPMLVAGLQRADSTIAIHVGDVQGYRVGTLAALGTLRGALGSGDQRVLSERLAIGDNFGHLGDYRAAANQYRDVQRTADAADQTAIAAHAKLRLANLYVSLAGTNRQIFTPNARHAIADLRDDSGPYATLLKGAADVFDARLAIARGDDGAVDRLIAAASKAAAGSDPVLVYAPPIKLTPGFDAAELDGSAGYVTSPNSRVAAPVTYAAIKEQWVDIGFDVGTDGRVLAPSVLRQSKQAGRRWVDPVLASIAGRRYVPGDGGYRVERYTRTAYFDTSESSNGSHIMRRRALPRLEMLDLTKGPAKQDAVTS